MIQTVWEEMPSHYPDFEIDAFVVMPNHIHAIMVLVGAGPCACPALDNQPPHEDGPPPPTGQPHEEGQPQGVAPTKTTDQGQHLSAPCSVGAGPCACPALDGPRTPPTGQPHEEGQPQGVAPTPFSLFDAVHRFKTLTTTRYGTGVKNLGWPAYPGRLWQRNYYEHVIRNEIILERIRGYIATNPARWLLDPENPAASKLEEENLWLQ